MIIDGAYNLVLAAWGFPASLCLAETRSWRTFLGLEAFICKTSALENVLSAEGKMKEKQS